MEGVLRPDSDAPRRAVSSPGERAMAEFVDEQWPRLFRTAYLMTGNRADAEDAVQTALAVVVERWPHIRRHDDPGGYAYRTLVRHIWRTASRRRSEVERTRRTQAPMWERGRG